MRSADASSTTSASVGTVYGNTETPTCTQTDPVNSSCIEGSLTFPETPYATAGATVSGPGVLSVSATAYDSGYAFASASFSYMIEVIGGAGQVLVLSSPLAAFTCTNSQSDVGAEPCGPPTVVLGGVTQPEGEVRYLATYGVPLSFAASASVGAGSGPTLGETEAQALDLPLSDLLLSDPNGPYSEPGTVVLLPDVPEPGTGITGALGLALLALSRRRANLRRGDAAP